MENGNLTRNIVRGIIIGVGTLVSACIAACVKNKDEMPIEAGSGTMEVPFEEVPEVENEEVTAE